MAQVRRNRTPCHEKKTHEMGGRYPPSSWARIAPVYLLSSLRCMRRMQAEVAMHVRPRQAALIGMIPDLDGPPSSFCRYCEYIYSTWVGAKSRQLDSLHHPVHDPRESLQLGFGFRTLN